ncbi:hypothetical protein AMAG_05425 [Allomyces macrogynus ATCC 38327]|uniref:Uncharacterized protein n=1 Tax=Allomyces macrogynus (strain ATCC 38327) TaxID=578462 RepID=A0A0L0SBY8_ALLM3|nr:hypothetical protein AMAG_05425 [Allomyces macrogynus ATCC 38327]|eukprot:KNE59981.1 hypothetical protein AMAG_05425 [Allomyces macrogynus ATCC 38327]
MNYACELFDATTWLIFVLAPPGQAILTRQIINHGVDMLEPIIIEVDREFPRVALRKAAVQLAERIRDRRSARSPHIVILSSPHADVANVYLTRLAATLFVPLAPPEFRIVHFRPPDALNVWWALEWRRAARVAARQEGTDEPAAASDPAEETALAVAWTNGHKEGVIEVANPQQVPADRVVAMPAGLEVPGGSTRMAMAALIMDAATLFYDARNPSETTINRAMLDSIRQWVSGSRRVAGRVIIVFEVGPAAPASEDVAITAARQLAVAVGAPIYVLVLTPSAEPKTNALEGSRPLTRLPIGQLAWLQRRHHLALHRTVFVTNKLLHPWVHRCSAVEWMAGRGLVPGWTPPQQPPTWATQIADSGARSDHRPWYPMLDQEPGPDGVRREQSVDLVHVLVEGPPIATLAAWIAAATAADTPGVALTQPRLADSQAMDSQVTTMSDSQVGAATQVADGSDTDHDNDDNYSPPPPPPPPTRKLPASFLEPAPSARRGRASRPREDPSPTTGEPATKKLRPSPPDARNADALPASASTPTPASKPTPSDPPTRPTMPGPATSRPNPPSRPTPPRLAPTPSVGPKGPRRQLLGTTTDSIMNSPPRPAVAVESDDDTDDEGDVANGKPFEFDLFADNFGRPKPRRLQPKQPEPKAEEKKAEPAKPKTVLDYFQDLF